MGETRLTKKEFAQVFGVTIRQVENWIVEGVPRIEVGRKRYAYGVPALQWAVRKIKERENGGPKGPRYQRDLINLEHAKLDLLARKGELVPISTYREYLDEVTARLGMVLQAIPARFARQMVGAKTIKESRSRLDDVKEELVGELRSAAEE